MRSRKFMKFRSSILILDCIFTAVGNILVGFALYGLKFPCGINEQREKERNLEAFGCTILSSCYICKASDFESSLHNLAD